MEGNRDSEPLSAFVDVTATAESIMGVFQELFSDYEPRDEDEQRAVFVVAAGIRRSIFDDDEFDQAVREKYLGFVDRPHGTWEVEISYDAVAQMAQMLVNSRLRPDTQLLEPSRLEMIVRDETPHSVLLPPCDRTIHQVSTPNGTFRVTVGPPSTALLMRCALRRSGFGRLSVFERPQLFEFLVEQEKRRSLTEENAMRVSAARLLKVMAKAGLRSLTVESPKQVAVEEMEQLATAFRVRLAYEASVVLAPVLDVDRLDGSSAQPTLIRQLHARVEEFVESIGRGTPTGHQADQLLGRPTITDDELSLRYLRAVAAADLFSAFMGYYHVLEYEMEEAWFDRLSKQVAAVGEVLPRPAGPLGSAAAKAAALLNVDKAKLRLTELRALQALFELRLDIRGFLPDLHCLAGAVDHFAKDGVPFVEVPLLDFAAAQEERNREELTLKVAERIYAVRCAITHSKASRRRYSPYRDDRHLSCEVPLVRIAAEQLLIPIHDRI